MSRYEKKLMGKMDDEIKLAGLEALVPAELEKHLISQLQSPGDFRRCTSGNRDVRGGENWFNNSQTECDSKPSDTGFREHSDPMDVGAVNSLSSGKGNWSSGPRDGCFKCGAAHFQRECNASKNTGKQSSGKGNQSKSWSMSEPSISGKGKRKENQGEAKVLSKGTKSENKGSKDAKLSCKGINLENGYLRS